jgi:hypothetical protein
MRKQATKHWMVATRPRRRVPGRKQVAVYVDASGHAATNPWNASSMGAGGRAQKAAVGLRGVGGWGA